MQPNIKKEQWNKIWSSDRVLNRIISSGRNFYNNFFQRLILKNIEGEKEMVELGCGTATIGLLLAPKIKSYTGIDYSEEAINFSQGLARKSGLKNISIIKGDILQLDSSLNNSFDLVWSQGLVEHFDNHLEAVAAHWQLARNNGGKVFISVPYKYSYHFLWFKLTRISFLQRFWPWEGTDVKFLTKKELLAIGKNFSADAKVSFVAFWPAGFLLGVIVLKMQKNDI